MTEEVRQQSSGSGLRQQLTQTLARLKASQQRVTDLEQRVYELELGEVLVGMKVPVALRGLALRNRVEATPEAVERFLSELQAEVDTAATALGALAPKSGPSS